MKLIIVFAVIACSDGAKLDRTYLPPPSASLSGGSAELLQTPFENQNTQPANVLNPNQNTYNNQRLRQPGLGNNYGLENPSQEGRFPSQDADTILATGDLDQKPFRSQGFNQKPLTRQNQNPGNLDGKQNFYNQQPVDDTQRDGHFANAGNKDSDFGPQKYNEQTDNSSNDYQARSNNVPNGQLQSNAPYERSQAGEDRAAEVLRYDSENDGETFAYSFETSNGITAEENGIATNGVQAQGAYSYIGDDGQSYSVTYVADENGYQPRGDHLPTPPPIPDIILKSIERNALAAANGYSEGPQDDSRQNKEELSQNFKDGSSDLQNDEDKPYESRPSEPFKSSITSKNFALQNNQQFYPETSRDKQYNTAPSGLQNYNSPTSNQQQQPKPYNAAEVGSQQFIEDSSSSQKYSSFPTDNQQNNADLSENNAPLTNPQQYNAGNSGLQKYDGGSVMPQEHNVLPTEFKQYKAAPSSSNSIPKRPQQFDRSFFVPRQSVNAPDAQNPRTSKPISTNTFSSPSDMSCDSSSCYQNVGEQGSQNFDDKSQKLVSPTSSQSQQPSRYPLSNTPNDSQRKTSFSNPQQTSPFTQSSGYHYPSPSEIQDGKRFPITENSRPNQYKTTPNLSNERPLFEGSSQSSPNQNAYPPLNFESNKPEPATSQQFSGPRFPTSQNYQESLSPQYSSDSGRSQVNKGSPKYSSEASQCNGVTCAPIRLTNVPSQQYGPVQSTSDQRSKQPFGLETGFQGNQNQNQNQNRPASPFSQRSQISNSFAQQTPTREYVPQSQYKSEPPFDFSQETNKPSQENGLVPNQYQPASADFSGSEPRNELNQRPNIGNNKFDISTKANNPSQKYNPSIQESNSYQQPNNVNQERQQYPTSQTNRPTSDYGKFVPQNNSPVLDNAPRYNLQPQQSQKSNGISQGYNALTKTRPSQPNGQNIPEYSRPQGNQKQSKDRFPGESYASNAPDAGPIADDRPGHIAQTPSKTYGESTHGQQFPASRPQPSFSEQEGYKL